MDCIIIGGGPAGLTAAIYLARFNRRVTVIDGGDSRARLIPTTHNYPGFANGVRGQRLLELLREQGRNYGVGLIEGRIERLKNDGERFVAEGADRVFEAAKVVLATGLIDRKPPIPRLPDAIAQGLVRYCPVCDGFEASDQRIAVLGHGNDASGKALFLRTYSRSVTLLTLDGSKPEQKSCAELENAGIARPLAIVAAIDHAHGKVNVTLADGERLTFDTLYPVLGCDVRSTLSTSLGAEHTEEGFLTVDKHQQTSVVGLYAIGDVVSDLHQIAVGTGHAAVAATHIHTELPRNLKF